MGRAQAVSTQSHDQLCSDYLALSVTAQYCKNISEMLVYTHSVSLETSAIHVCYVLQTGTTPRQVRSLKQTTDGAHAIAVK